jgi:hypothetical protein
MLILKNIIGCKNSDVEEFERFFLSIPDVDETLLKRTCCSPGEYCYADDQINAMLGSFIAGKKAAKKEARKRCEVSMENTRRENE